MVFLKGYVLIFYNLVRSIFCLLLQLADSNLKQKEEYIDW